MSYCQDVLNATEGNYYQKGRGRIVRIEGFGSQACPVILFSEDGENLGQSTIRTEELKKYYKRVSDEDLVKIGLLEKSAFYT